ncbi:hypothetical protein ACVIWV_001729 [Bradyrhizobium diazoefficiens]
MKPGADLLDEGTCGIGEDQLVRHEDVAELHAIGAGAVHGEERLAGRERDGGIGAVGQEHHSPGLATCDALIVLALEDGAEIMIGAEIGDPGQRAADDVAALDLPPFQLELLDAEEALHRIGEPGAAEHPAGREGIAEAPRELHIGGVGGVPDQRVLAPGHERRGAQTSPIAAIAWMAQRKSAGPSCGM